MSTSLSSEALPVSFLKKLRKVWRRVKRGVLETRLGCFFIQRAHGRKDNSYIVSYPKCGRTWVATVVTHYVGLRKGLVEDDALPFSTRPHRENPEFTSLGRRVIFSHDRTNAKLTPEDLAGVLNFAKYPSEHPLVVLVRDPRDVTVSRYHHIRARRHKRDLIGDMKMDAFLKAPELGVERLIVFYNFVAGYVRRHEKARLVRYEDLHQKNPGHFEVWKEMFAFLFEEDVDDALLQKALEMSAFDKMKAREKSSKSKANRVRSGKVGGYKDEMRTDSVEWMNEYIREHLNDMFAFYKTP